MITRETFSAAPAWAVFHGEAADPGPVFWGLFDINPGDYGFVEDPAHDLEALDVDFIEPELDDNHGDEQPPGSDDLDAALAYLRRGGTLCKVPDAPGSSFWRLLVVGKPVPAHELKIEARTKAGPIVWQPYPSHAAAEKALPALKKQAKALGVVRDSWQIAPVQGQAETATSTTRRPVLSDEEHAALALVRTRIGRRWKAALRRAWESGDYRDIASAGEHLPGVLQRLRNASYFGPSGLATYKPSSNRQREIKPPNASPLDLLGAIEALFIDSPYFPLRIGDRIDVIGDDDVVLAAIRMRGNEAVVEQVGSGARAARARLQVATWLSARIARAKERRS